MIFKGDEYIKKKIKALTNLGIYVDLLNKEVNVVAPSKNLTESMVPLNFLMEIAEFILEAGLKNKKAIIDLELIPERQRNETIFRWINSLKVNQGVKNEVSEILKLHFCNPPLPKDKMISIMSDAQDCFPYSQKTNNNLFFASPIKADDKYLLGTFGKNYVYLKEVDTWYQYRTKHWVLLSEKNIISNAREFFLENAGNFQSRLTESNLLAVVGNLLSRILLASAE